MTEKLVPCFLDPRRECNFTCPLRDFSEEVIDEHSRFGDPTETVQYLRQGLNTSTPKELAKFITRQIDIMEDVMPIEQCQYYPSSK